LGRFVTGKVAGVRDAGREGPFVLNSPPAHGMLHHAELWVPDLDRAGFALPELGQRAQLTRPRAYKGAGEEAPGISFRGVPVPFAGVLHKSVLPTLPWDGRA
jgi:hypothetical protein